MGDLIPISAAPSVRTEGDSAVVSAGAPSATGVIVVDKRGKNNGTAGRVAAERAAREQKRQAQEAWTKQAAATMWWSAQRADIPTEIGERILAKREELLDGARKQKILRA